MCPSGVSHGLVVKGVRIYSCKFVTHIIHVSCSNHLHFKAVFNMLLASPYSSRSLTSRGSTFSAQTHAGRQSSARYSSACRQAVPSTTSFMHAFAQSASVDLLLLHFGLHLLLTSLFASTPSRLHSSVLDCPSLEPGHVKFNL